LPPKLFAHEVSVWSLVIAVRLVCLALGFLVARIEYLRRHALFHADEGCRRTDEVTHLLRFVGTSAGII